MDPIADMITMIRNAGLAGKESLLVPHSKEKLAIALVLKKEGYLKNVTEEEKKGRKVISITLLGDRQNPRIRGSRRISKTSKRVYKKASELRPVKNGYGLLVVTTPKGVMSSGEARKAGVGGEVLFSIW